MTDCSESRVLRVIHLKPWSAPTSTEKLDVNNGLLLSAGIDACFDKGLISVDGTGVILISESVTDFDRIALGLELGMKLD